MKKLTLLSALILSMSVAGAYAEGETTPPAQPQAAAAAPAAPAPAKKESKKKVKKTKVAKKTDKEAPAK